MSKEYTYSMPQKFMDDPNVALKWKLYGYLNGFWLAGKPVYARNDTISKQFGKAERSVQEALSELERMGLITRDIKGLSRYILPGGLKDEGRGPASPIHEAQPHQRDEAQPHHISDSISDSLRSAPRAPEFVVVEREESERNYTSDAQLLDEATDLWASINPLYERWKRKNKTERSALDKLLGEEGFSWLENACALLEKTNGRVGFSIITKPSVLYNMRAEFQAQINREKGFAELRKPKAHGRGLA